MCIYFGTEVNQSPILKLVKGENRGCEFRNVVAYMDRNHTEPVFFEGLVRGTISEEERGVIDRPRKWSKLHAIFVPEGFGKTLAEMNDKEYEKFRGTRNPIFKEFGEWLTRECGLKRK